MPTAAQTTRKPLFRFKLPTEKGNEIVGVVLAAVVLMLLGSLVSYHPSDPSLLHKIAGSEEGSRNFIGPFGAQLSSILFALVGLTAFLLPVTLGFVAWRRLSGQEGPQVGGRVLGLAGVLLALPALLQLTLEEVPWRGAPMRSGGALGAVTADVLVEQLNFGGAFVVLLTVLLICGSLAVQSTLGEVFFGLRKQVLRLYDRLRLRFTQYRERRSKEEARRRVINRHAERVREAKPKPPSEASAAAPHPKLDLPMRVTPKKGEGRFKVRKVTVGGGSAETAAPGPAARSAAGRKKAAPERPAQESLAFAPEELKPAELPPVNLLRTDVDSNKIDENELVQRGEVIRTSCEEFGVHGTIEGIGPGPVITVYELQPAPGVKVSRIVGLQDDLALALKAESVRIDRIPGRSTLGLEVPNDERQIIRLGQLFADPRFKKAPSVLTMALGVDIHGEPIYMDLATMPHLLVAGATGAGKSVGLQSMITSILYKATREEVQFIFIDPKRIELGVYADIPHLKCEVVVEPKKAANALRWAVSEMERRYRLLAEVHVRSIDYYNRAIRDPKERERLSLQEGESEFKPEDFKPLPYYVVVIDELADLMMVASSDVETSIARLAQMARAVGIHLIVATQRPSVDVLTGTIKANFPCRLAYATATRHDSRTILDQVGAEKLLGKGDALLMPPGTSRIMRMHGAYITEQESAGLIRWLKRRGKPQLDPEVVKAPEEKKGGSGGGDADDDLYDEAVRLVVSEGMGSASFLQRRMRVGFSRAARLIDMMAQDGILGPAQGSKPREVLVKGDYFEELDRAKADQPL